MPLARPCRSSETQSLWMIRGLSGPPKPSHHRMKMSLTVAPCWLIQVNAESVATRTHCTVPLVSGIAPPRLPVLTVQLPRDVAGDRHAPAKPEPSPGECLQGRQRAADNQRPR